MARLRGVEPAVWLWAAVIALALGGDAWLVRNGHRSLSQVADCRAGRAARGYLSRHLDGELVLDAFALAARLIRRRTIT